MDAFYSYTYGTAGWLSLQAVPLIISPRIIVTLLSPEVRDSSALELYFSRTYGLTLIAFSFLSLLLTGSVPLSSSPDSEAPASSETKSPYATPALAITTVYHSLTSFYCYMMWTQTDSMGFALGIVGSGGLAAMGLWVTMFGSGQHISKRTGADKRTSGFPFKNVEAEKRKGGKGL